MSTRDYAQFYFFFFLLAVSFVLAFFIARPFLSAIFLAIMFAVVFFPIYKKILFFLNGRKNLSALIAVFLILIIVLVPLVYFGSLIFNELADLYSRMLEDENSGAGLENFIANVGDYLNSVFPALELDTEQYFNLGEVARQVLGLLVENLRSFFTGFVKIAVNLFLMVLAMFYLFRDGQRLKSLVVRYSPLSDHYNEKILEKLRVAINSVVVGRVLVGIIQGIFSGIGLAVFGVPNAILWAFVIAIFSMLPLLGPMFVVIPASIFLYFSAGLLPAVGLFAWGVVGVALIDEYMGSVIVDRGMKIHPFIILISILGGIVFMGPIGFIVGPLITGLLFALLDMYPMILEEKSQ